MEGKNDFKMLFGGVVMASFVFSCITIFRVFLAMAVVACIFFALYLSNMHHKAYTALDNPRLTGYDRLDEFIKPFLEMEKVLRGEKNN